jgi:TolB-like protein/Tfp pilus assembly protein PilF
MTPERWRRIEALYHAARSRDEDERGAFLTEACAGDASLKGEVESLLAATGPSALDSDPAPRAADFIGRQFGDYRIQSRLGAGGMGEVYLAHDVRLRRDVAVKTLPRLFTSDPVRLARFEREARMLAALNHPHIGAIYGVVDVEGAPALVLELVDGETLAERIARGPIPVAESLAIARQLVAALAAAHAKGIVHRDLKPANIKINRGGGVKVLDFGLAKGLVAGGTVGLTVAPTLTGDATRPGVMVGTAAYMSPEQARGQAVDERTDLWAFGCVLYEMLTGRRVFGGQTIPDAFAAVLEREPDWSALPARTPTNVRQLLADCLQKDPGRRPQGVAAASAVLAEGVSRQMWPAWSRRLAAATMAIALGVLGWRLYPTSQGVKSLAILPFVNESGRPDLEYVSDGITEALIDALSSPNLHVESRVSVFRFKGQDFDVPAIATTLKVDALLVGRMLQHDDQLAFSVELVDGSTSRRLWGARYNRTVQDLLAVQEAISIEISEALRLKLTEEERQRMTRRYTQNTEAYRLYLLGRSEWNKKTPPGFQKGIEYFEKAINADPSYAPAYAAVAALYNNLANYNFAILPPKEAGSMAKRRAEQALQIDDTLASAHASLALVAYQWEWDWRKAEQEFKRALALSFSTSSTLEPNLASTYHWYAHYLMTRGRVDESLDAGLRALDLEPLDGGNNAHQGWHHLFQRQYDLAVAPLLKAIDLDPTFVVSRWYLGMAYEQQGKYDDAIAKFEECARLTRNRPSMLALLGHAYAAAGRRRDAEDVLDRLLTPSSPQPYVASYPIAVIYAALDDKQKAFEWLEQALRERDSWLNYLGLDPRLDKLRGEAQFAELMRRLDLPTITPR